MTHHPNILIIMADEIRADVVLHAKYPFVRTPNLDRLRAHGTTFRQAFCQTPTCCPSRGSFTTGKYPQELGLYNHGCVLPPEEKTMGHWFAENGYDAVAFGKTHNMNPGFRSVTYEIGQTMGTSNHGYKVTDDTATGVFNGPKDDFCDFVACRQFDDYLTSQDRGKPFLAFVGIYSPHPPLYPPAEYASLYSPDSIELPPDDEAEWATKPQMQGVPRQRWHAVNEETRRRIVATALGMTTLVDDCVGRLLDTLEREGELDSTIIVFTSDHGDQMGEHGMLGKFFNFYEASLRVPLIMRGPGIAAGKDRDQLVELTDVYPTLCDLTGIARPVAPNELSGRSLDTILQDPDTPHRDYVHCMIEKAHMVRTDHYKCAVYEEDRGELYDLQADPMATNNLYDNPAVRDTQLELTTEIVRHLTRHRRSVFNPGKNGFFG